MTKIIAFIAASLDGFIAGKGNDLSWLDDYNNIPGEDYGYSRFLKKVRIVVMGRVTYEQVLKFKEYPYKGIRTYVVTSRHNIRKADKDVIIWNRGMASLMRELKKAKKGVIWPVGGGKLLGWMASHGVIDEYKIYIAPKVLGAGTPLFSGITKPLKLKFVSKTHFKSGLVLLRYRK